ncbi:unnamed protein product [Urochloa humidicola]
MAADCLRATGIEGAPAGRTAWPGLRAANGRRAARLEGSGQPGGRAARRVEGGGQRGGQSHAAGLETWRTSAARGSAGGRRMAGGRADRRDEGSDQRAAWLEGRGRPSRCGAGVDGGGRRLGRSAAR